MDGAGATQRSVADALLRALRQRGIRHVFANAGTDFAPIIEALCGLGAEPEAAPQFLTVPHENLAVAMAHGYFLAGGRPAAVMVHVTVGTANTVCALMNASRDNVPLLLMAGRTPHSQAGHIASRSAPIHWGQENFDQDGVVREYTKWAYELRAGQAPADIVGRALDIALAEPAGPVYLTLPREVLAEADQTQSGCAAATRTITPPQPDLRALQTLAGWLADAENPVIVTATLGRSVPAVHALDALCRRFAIPVVETGATCVNLPASHPMRLGNGGRHLLADADVIVVADCAVPWFPRSESPRGDAKVAHLGMDPLFARYPTRIFPGDLVVPGSTASALRAIADALPEGGSKLSATLPARSARVAAERDRLSEQRAAAIAAGRTGRPIRYAFVADCLRRALPDDAIVVTELGVSADQLMLERPGSLIGVGIGGGLGFGLGASLGAKAAAPERTVVCTLGDGSYMFGNPTPFHFVSRAANLPTLTIICNNRRWHAVDAATRVVYPDGKAAAADPMPLVELQPSPEFSKVAEASDAFARRIDDPQELPAAIDRALTEVAAGRQALLDVRMEHRGG
jgi:acetolactate synthase-1/2/3 large subunit